MIYPSDAMTDYETADFTIRGRATVVDYRITETNQLAETKEVFTDLGHGRFRQEDVADGFDELIVDVEIVDWCYPDESPFEWTQEDKKRFIEWLNDGNG